VLIIRRSIVLIQHLV